MRAICIVLDSVGIGALPDAYKYGDENAATLQNLAKAVGGLNLPNLQKLGLGNIENILGLDPVSKPLASYGKMLELSPGKDTTTGHWELMGIKLEKPFPLFPNGFPLDFIRRFEKAIGREVLGNYAASGTEIIMQLGDEHVKTGKPIVYTSADSVFQIAAHEEVIRLEELYRICKIAREMLQPPELGVARVIARPFIGTSGNYKRTSNRHDYSLPPIKETLLDYLQKNNIITYGIGKIYDIFAGKGITRHVTTTGNSDGMQKTYNALMEIRDGFIFTNLVDYDMLYGHRRDVWGYKKALEEFDNWLGEFIKLLDEKDLLIVTADHGCDPTYKGTDHTREYVFVLAYQKGKEAKNLGVRQGFWDVAATIAKHFNLNFEVGKAF